MATLFQTLHCDAQGCDATVSALLLADAPPPPWAAFNLEHEDGPFYSCSRAHDPVSLEPGPELHHCMFHTVDPSAGFDPTHTSVPDGFVPTSLWILIGEALDGSWKRYVRFLAPDPPPGSTPPAGPCPICFAAPHISCEHDDYPVRREAERLWGQLSELTAHFKTWGYRVSVNVNDPDYPFFGVESMLKAAPVDLPNGFHISVNAPGVEYCLTPDEARKLSHDLAIAAQFVQSANSETPE